MPLGVPGRSFEFDRGLDWTFGLAHDSSDSPDPPGNLYVIGCCGAVDMTRDTKGPLCSTCTRTDVTTVLCTLVHFALISSGALDALLICVYEPGPVVVACPALGPVTLRDARCARLGASLFFSVLFLFPFFFSFFLFFRLGSLFLEGATFLFWPSFFFFLFLLFLFFFLVNSTFFSPSRS